MTRSLFVSADSVTEAAEILTDSVRTRSEIRTGGSEFFEESPPPLVKSRPLGQDPSINSLYPFVDIGKGEADH